MKKLLLILSAVMLISGVFSPQQANAQTPGEISYQAVIRDANDSLITNQSVGMQISILEGSPEGEVIYSEIQNPTTNSNGLISVKIGGDANFNNIDWSSGPYFIKTETNIEGGNNYTITGTSQLLSVPYALHAKTASSIQQPGASVPVGSVISFAGENIPENYLICDGSEISRTEYSELFTALGESWGAGDGSSSFNLPDLRGQFIRGVDGSADVDPNKENRTAIHTGGNTGNNVGTYQQDEFKNHNHTMERGTNMTGGYNAPCWAVDLTSGSFQTDYSGGDETRPKNAYVYFIIRCK